MEGLELAWAAGFFDGEGNTHHYQPTNRLQIQVNQNHPEVLERFAEAVECPTVVRGPYDGSGNSKPYWRFQVYSHTARRVLELIWPYLSGEKKRQAEEAITAYESERLRKGR